MNLYLLRHGLAVERSGTSAKEDAKRPLTPKGRRKIRQIAKAIKRMDLSFDAILTSPLPRALATAQIVARTLGIEDRLECKSWLAPGSSRAKLFAHLRGLRPAAQEVLLVGHEPDLSALASSLLTGRGDLDLTLRKGGLCKLDVTSFRAGRSARLEWLLAPSHLAAMA